MFLHDVKIDDYMLLCGRYVFDNENMHVNIHFFNYKNIITKTLIIVMMVSTAFKLGNYKVPLTKLYISFIGRIHSKPKQDGDDCMIGVNINECNNFNFTNKRRINFKIYVVYDVRRNERNDGTKRNETGLKKTKRNDVGQKEIM